MREYYYICPEFFKNGTTMGTEEELLLLLRKAKENHDEEILNQFQEFGSSERQQVMNYRNYHQWLECGYKGEISFDKYGWCTNEIPASDIEKIELWHNDYTENYIEVAQLPNGKWVNGCFCTLTESGCAGGCSIWGEKYETRLKALDNAIKRITEQIQRGTNADKKHLADIKKVRLEMRQLSLF